MSKSLSASVHPEVTVPSRVQKEGSAASATSACCPRTFTASEHKVRGGVSAACACPWRVRSEGGGGPSMAPASVGRLGRVPVVPLGTGVMSEPQRPQREASMAGDEAGCGIAGRSAELPWLDPARAAEAEEGTAWSRPGIATVALSCCTAAGGSP